MNERRWKIAGINFDHFHMGDLLRYTHDHPGAELVGICDAQAGRMEEARRNFEIPADRVFMDEQACLAATRPDVVILCPSAATHAEWVERVAPSGAHMMVEKPMASTLAEADRMMAAAKAGGGTLAINWPSVWSASHVYAFELAVSQRLIGPLLEVHTYGGNRGPLYHGADKIEMEPTAEQKAQSWFYKRNEGGGSLLDYLGYGTTMASWYLEGRAPVEVMAMTWTTPGLEVDEHAIAVLRYEFGLSCCETRWGTFTDPWTHQPQPRCGYVLKGADGTIASWDYADSLHIQTRDCPQGRDMPVPPLTAPHQNPVQHFLHHLETGAPLIGPLTPAISRLGQQIVDTAVLSAASGRVERLVS
jgi:predicted dehydrogenase